MVLWGDGDMSAKYWHRLAHECELWQQGLTQVAGVDEAGCGPLAGPVVAAAVVFPCSWLGTGLFNKLRGLNDSKQLTPEQREKYFAVLTGHPEIRYGIASLDVDMIDRINIRQAAWRAMHRALEQLNPRAQHVLVDGLKIRWLPYPQTAMVQGDARSYSIAAASVLAKVSRDRMMLELDRQFPGYGFAEHKGYATPQHYAAIRERGPCAIHRKSFYPFRPVETELDLFAADSETGCATMAGAPVLAPAASQTPSPDTHSLAPDRQTNGRPDPQNLDPAPKPPPERSPE